MSKSPGATTAGGRSTIPRRRDRTSGAARAGVKKGGNAQKRILLLCAESLLAKGLENILGPLKGVELVGPWAPEAAALERLTQDEPGDVFDLILIADSRGESEAALVAQIMEQHPDLPVARVGLDDNAIRLYTSRALPARRADLIELIRSLPVRKRRRRNESSS